MSIHFFNDFIYLFLTHVGFVTRNSVEERVTQVAKRKMMLTHLVVRPGTFFYLFLYNTASHSTFNIFTYALKLVAHFSIFFKHFPENNLVVVVFL